MSKERPILFSGPMLKAILDGRKGQTRRVAPIERLDLTRQDWNGKEAHIWTVEFLKPVRGIVASHSGCAVTEGQARRIIASDFNPYGKPGDYLWVRETHGIVPVTAYGKTAPHAVDPNNPHQCVIYREGFERCWSCATKPAIHMPRWASRILLRIADVRVERVQDISAEDCIAEGLSTNLREFDAECHLRQQFCYLWDSINGKKPGAAWIDNPWVWVVSFKRVEEAKR